MSQFNANKQNLPNPAKLLDSLRSTGYDNYHAIMDIVDNCIDADAQNIWINISGKNKDLIITIADDGRGMDFDNLDEALKLGSETEKEIESDLGRFGMGLSTATLSMCKRTTVLTQVKNGNLFKSETDLDWVLNYNEFKKYLGEPNQKEQSIFKEFIKNNESGTVVTLSKCDRIQNSDPRVFGNTLRKHCGRVFRKFIEAGKKIYINDTIIESKDPLMLDDPKTRLYSDEEYPIMIQKDDIVYEDTIRIRMVLLPDYGIDGNKHRGINYVNQGFYVMRNERELFDGSNLGIFTKDAHYNRFRAEIYFSGTLDKLVGVHFTKRGISIDQALLDKLKEFTKSQIRQIKKLADSERPKKEKNVSHNDSEKIISKKSKLLLKPPPQINSRKPKTDKKVKTQKTVEKTNEFITDKLRSICQFEERAMDKVGPLYSPSLVGRKVIITWNTDHPFYKLIIEKKEDKTFVTSLDFLIYSLASAELKAINDENVTLLEEIRQDMSHNLKVLVD